MSSLFRWLIPATITLILLLFLNHESQFPQFFSRYSLKFCCFLVSIGMWTSLSWWIILNNFRYYQLLNRIIRLPISILLTIILLLTLSIYIFADNNLLPLALLLSIILVLLIALLSAKSLKSSATNIALVAISTAMVFICAEVLFRLVLLEKRVPTSEKNFDKLISSSWIHPVTVKKDSNTFRILGLADSFGRAGGHKNYYYLLENQLQKKYQKYEVVNISSSGYDLPDELSLLKHMGIRYHPDLIIHGFFVGNDFNVQIGALLNYHGISVRAKTGLENYLPHNFLFLKWLHRFMVVISDQLNKKAEIAQNKTSGDISQAAFLEIERRTLEICRKGFENKEKWKKTLQILDQIRKEAKKIGAKYLLVIHPDQFQVEETLIDQVVKQYSLDLNNYDIGKPQEFLRNYCEAEKITCLDLLPFFKTHSSSGELYLLRNTHYSMKGNMLAANTIHDFLINNNELIGLF